MTGASSGVGWLKASEDAVSSAYGWSPTNDSFAITIDSVAPEGGRVAYVSYSYNTATFIADVQELVLEENDFDPPYVSVTELSLTKWSMHCRHKTLTLGILLEMEQVQQIG